MAAPRLVICLNDVAPVLLHEVHGCDSTHTPSARLSCRTLIPLLHFRSRSCGSNWFRARSSNSSELRVVLPDGKPPLCTALGIVRHVGQQVAAGTSTGRELFLFFALSSASSPSVCPKSAVLPSLNNISALSTSLSFLYGRQLVLHMLKRNLEGRTDIWPTQDASTNDQRIDELASQLPDRARAARYPP